MGDDLIERGMEIFAADGLRITPGGVTPPGNTWRQDFEKVLK
jgi:hypothetical protein